MIDKTPDLRSPMFVNQRSEAVLDTLFPPLKPVLDEIIESAPEGDCGEYFLECLKEVVFEYPARLDLAKNELATATDSYLHTRAAVDRGAPYCLELAEPGDPEVKEYIMGYVLSVQPFMEVYKSKQHSVLRMMIVFRQLMDGEPDGDEQVIILTADHIKTAHSVRTLARHLFENL